MVLEPHGAGGRRRKGGKLKWSLMTFEQGIQLATLLLLVAREARGWLTLRK